MPALCPLTFNVALNYVDAAKAIADLKAINPSAIVLSSDRPDDARRFDAMAREFPEAMIVCRIVPPGRRTDDASWHLPGSQSGWRLSPVNFLNTFGGLGTNGKFVYVLNEPDGYHQVDRLVPWLLQVVEEATRRNIRLCLGNLATGHPRDADQQTWDRIWDPLLVLLSQPPHRRLHVLGLHEYHPGWDYRVGRFRWMLESCRRLFIMPPRILITEFGIDADHAGSTHNGWRSRGMTEQAYFDLCSESYQRVYRAAVRGGILAGIALFTYGNSGGWEAFDVQEARTFQRLIATSFPREQVLAALPDTVPLPAAAYPLGALQVVNGGGGFIRTGPGPNYRVVLQMARSSPSEVALLPGYKDADGWLPIRCGAAEGWTHGDFVRFTPAGGGPPPAQRTVTLSAPSAADLERFLAEAKRYNVSIKSQS